MKLEGFIGPSYTLEAPSANYQRALNVYLESQPAPRKDNPGRLVGTPGLRKRLTVGTGPIRGVHWSSTNQLFVVSGSNLYEVTADWTANLRTGTLNSIAGRVTMADNGTSLMVADGDILAFVADLAFGSALGLADADCPGGHVTWIDGYFVNSKPATGKFQISGINATTYDALDIATAEGRPDNLVIPIASNRLLWLFGETSTEVWWDSGGADFPFQRNESAFIETGTASAGSCVRVNNSVSWLGNDERGRGTVWHAQGFQPVRISTHAVELALSGYANLSQAYAFAYQQLGHEFYQLTVPASTTDNGGTWVYDFAVGQWHERSYLNGGVEETHRASCATSAFGMVVVGDKEDGRLYTYEPDYFSDDGGPIRRLRRCPHMSQGEKFIKFNSFELQAEPGVGLAGTSAQGVDPLISLSWSDDGGHTWSNIHKTSMGKAGEHLTRLKWRRLGISRDRVFQVETTEPVRVTWLGADVDAVQLAR